jgi:hypothetical protein
MNDGQPSLPATSPPRAVDTKGASRPGRVTGKLKVALDLMVFGPTEGDNLGCALAMDDAAREAGLTTRTIRLALDRPHVRQYLNQQKQVFRASASAQNISALVKLRDKSGNAMAQLGAIKVLEQIGDEPGAGAAAARTPGMTIVIVQNGPVSEPPQPKTITFDAADD